MAFVRNSSTPYFSLHYDTNFRMEITRVVCDRMRITTNRVALVGYAIFAPLSVLFDLYINTGRAVWNAIFFVINSVSYLIYRITLLFRSCFAPGLIPVIPSPFSLEHLNIFKNVLEEATSSNEKARIYLDQGHCEFWYDASSQTVNVQSRNISTTRTLSLQITESGQISKISVDGVSQSQFPQDFEIYLWACLIEAFKISSLYEMKEDTVHIELPRESIQQVPEHHLYWLGELLQETSWPPEMKVKFLQSDLRSALGADYGAPSRDFMREWAAALVLNGGEDLKFLQDKETGMFMPVTPDRYDVKKAHPPSLSKPARRLYEKLGAVMVYTYVSDRNLVLGRKFEDFLFTAAFALTPEEASCPFESLELRTLLKMIRPIYQAKGLPLGILNDLEKNNRGNLSIIADACDPLPEGQDSPFNRVKKKVFTEGGIDRVLAPIHAIAIGIYDAKRKWGLRDNNMMRPLKFSTGVQGEILNKEETANAFRLGREGITPHIREVHKWLQDWIRDPATPTPDIQNLLIFATGSPCLKNKATTTIYLTPQKGEDIPTPRVQACFNQLEIAKNRCGDPQGYNDHTKESFLKALQLALAEPGDYGLH